MFNLFKAVDQTSKNIRIKERFAKLTLSSNKKREVAVPRTRNECVVENSTRRNLSNMYEDDNIPSHSHRESDETRAKLNAMEDKRSSNGELDILSHQMSHLTMENEITKNNVSETEGSDESLLDGSEQSAITISSSSEDSNYDAMDKVFDCNLVTSSIAVSGETENFILPCTLSNDRADRVEAYLRDISQHFGSDWQQHDSVELNDDGGNIDSQNTPKSKNINAMEKEFDLANADTESMTALSNGEASVCKTVDNTVETNETELNKLRRESSNIKSIPEEFTFYDGHSDSDKTIPETPSECTSESNCIEEAVDQHGNEDDGQNESNGENEVLSTQKSDIHLEVGSINISAKFKIKIKIQENAVSSESEIDDDDSNYSSASNVALHKRALNTTENIATASSFSNKDDNTTNKKNSKTENETSDTNFMTHAEKLLTQLYGQSWQTPEVIRSLKTKVTNNNGTKTEHDKTDANKSVLYNGDAEDQSGFDFSMFRKHVDTNLNSTCVTPKRPQRISKLVASKSRSPTIKKNSLVSTHKDKERHMERKNRALNAKNQLKDDKSKNWRRPGVNKDNDSIYNCASDSSDMDVTKNNSDHTWSGESCNRNLKIVSDEERKTQKRSTKQKSSSSNSKLVYLDLSKYEVSVVECTPKSPKANGDISFNTNLENILRSCKAETKSKLPSTTKRKLFTFDFLDEMSPVQCPDTPKLNKHTYMYDDETLLRDEPNYKELQANHFKVLDKRVHALKTRGEPIFAITPQTTKTTSSTKNSTNTNSTKKAGSSTKSKSSKNIDFATIKSNETPVRRGGQKCAVTKSEKVQKLQAPLENKYGFLKSLDVSVSKSFCHPEALVYRENYRAKKEELATLLYDLYNTVLFDNNLNTPLIWNKKLSNTAGRCLNKTKNGIRSSTIELSEKVLSSADRLRCTLIHELCHAATWIFNGEGGHGNVWKSWARKAMIEFPELPKIGVCHQYDIEYKYTYKCTLCNAKSHAHSKSKKVENIRCSYCHGAIEIFLNKKDKRGNILPTPLREPVGFAKFVKDNYRQFKKPDMKHGDVMKLLSAEFAALKVAGTDNVM